VRQLEREVQRLREDLAARELKASGATPDAVEDPALAPPPLSANLPAVLEDKPAPATLVASVMTKPMTWFGVAGWGLALLLLFRRRSI